MSGVNIDVPQVETAATDLDRVAGELEVDIQQPIGVINAGLGGPADDGFYQEFMSTYGPQAQQVLGWVTAQPDQVRTLADSASASATSYDLADADGAATINSVHDAPDQAAAGG